MIKTYTFKYLVTLLLGTGISIFLQAQSFKLIDINKTSNSNPGTSAELKGIFYFQADDGIHGAELYASDGTAAGTRLVKDIRPGTASSDPSNIITSGNRIYFVTVDHDPESGDFQKIWVSDGTDTGTHELNPSPQGQYGSYKYLTDINGTLYFSYSFLGDEGSNSQIGKSDGTAPGTVFIANGLYRPGPFVNFNGKLFFSAGDSLGYQGAELYTSDGTVEGTVMLKDIWVGENSSEPRHLTVLNGLLYFEANDGTGDKLWVSDGTYEGTRAVKNPHNINFAPTEYPFTIKGKSLYFAGASFNNTTSTGYELCEYNTSGTNGVTLVKDIIAGVKSSNPGFITNVNGTLYFSVTPDSSDAQLWKSDGTGAGTVLVKDINPGGINRYYGLTNVNGTLLFAYGNNALGTELWKSDGTGAGTALVKDIFPGTVGSNPANFIYKNGIFIFSAGSPAGVELWRSNGTEQGTVMVKDINQSSTLSSDPAGFASINGNKTIFTARNGRSLGNLFITDGSEAGTTLIDVAGATVYSFGANNTFVKLKDARYFIDTTFHLWKTDGTKAGTSMLPTPAFADGKNTVLRNFAATQNLLYVFTYNNKTRLSLIWRSDGTSAGTFVVKTDLAYRDSLEPTALGNILFFAAYNPKSNHSTLWRTDGSTAGTTLLLTSASFQPVDNLCIFKGKLFFTAFTTADFFGGSLWISDGTLLGTTLVKDMEINSTAFGQANGKLFFDAFDSESGESGTDAYKLFTSDGTAAGTRKVNDTIESFPQFFVSGDTLVYFLATYRFGSGRLLFKSNGTSEGTKLVTDFDPGSLEKIATIHNTLFFVRSTFADSTGPSDSLWQSDGTEAGTHSVQDPSLNGITKINTLAAIDNRVYLTALTYAAGNELYVGSIDGNKPPTVSIINPANNQAFLAGATVHLQAAAGDPDGTISKVEFYNGSTLLTTEHKIPYTFDWRVSRLGSYIITAKATDNQGAVTTSAPVNISVVANKAPSVSIINPLNEQSFTAPATINLEAAAEDPDGRIVQVSFYNGTTLLTNSEHKVPYTYQWQNVPAGTYIITAVAKDNWSAETTSTPVTVAVLPAGKSPVSSRPSFVSKKIAAGEVLSVRLSPNPVTNILNISTTGLQQNKQSAVSVISASGVVIKTVQTNSVSSALRRRGLIQLDVSALAAGIYFIKIINGDKVIYTRFVKML